MKARAHSPAHGGTELAASIESDDATVHADAAHLLTAAGIQITEAADLLLVLLSCGAAARLERCRKLLAARPSARVIVSLAADAGRSTMRRALQGGVHGIVLDGQLPLTLVPTVKAVLAGQLAVPSGLRRQLAPQALSFREKQIMSLVVAGYTNRQIADELFVAESTVKTHLSSAFTKLDARSRAEAAALILDPEEGYGPAILSLVEGIAPRAA